MKTHITQTSAGNSDALTVLNETTNALRDLLSEYESRFDHLIRQGSPRDRATVRDIISRDSLAAKARLAMTRAICVLDKAEEAAA